jgi:hypothetical protein
MDEKSDASGSRPGPTPEELMASIDTRVKQLENRVATLVTPPPDRTLTGRIASFFSSGFFFLLLGGALLFVAQDRMSTNHAGITFVLVVLGVALLLYGTGTQGMGQFTSGAGAGYNIAIAGGAGVVAFIVAYGIIKYSTDMRDAFQPERKFVRVLVQGGDGVTDIAKYASTFEIDGVAVPAAVKARNVVEVYIPYLPYEIVKPATPNPVPQPALQVDDKGMCPTTENREALRSLDQRATTKMVSARFYRTDAGTNPDALLPRADSEFMVRLDQSIFRSNDGGIDYPRYPVRICVNLQQVDLAIAAVNRREIGDSAAINKLKTNLPPAVIEAQ